ncbi:MAG: LysR substrate-binding domain-containing protein, partial [Alphaproteobacteria bacterium]|nr:LysR substrate-binding domain-containing protein [Alphaproteobacteria bacterium]
MRQLRALAGIMRHGSTKAAAEALNVTPPAITQQLQQLEALAGLPLIERSHRAVQVTQAGQELLRTIDHIEALLSDCAEGLHLLQGGAGGQVNVGVISTAKYFAPQALASFAKSHPSVEMRLVVGNRQETIAGLQSFDLDLAIMGRPPQDFGVDTAIIGDHPHVIIAAPDHRLAKRRRISLADVNQETFLLREQGSGTRTLVSRMFDDAGIDLDATMEIGSNETIKQAVIAGLGIALISAHTIAAEIQDRRLITLDV